MHPNLNQQGHLIEFHSQVNLTLGRIAAALAKEGMPYRTADVGHTVMQQRQQRLDTTCISAIATVVNDIHTVAAHLGVGVL